MKARSNLVEELRKSLKPGMFADQITAQTNKFSGMRISRSMAPGPSNTVNQAAWRAKYASGVAYWNTLTDEQKAVYQENADKRRITVFNQFMSLWLLDLVENIYARYITGDTAASGSTATQWRGQTFTIGNTGTNENHNITSVFLKIYRVGYPGPLLVAIRATAAGLPVGGDLASGEIDGNTLTPITDGEWIRIALAPNYPLLASTKYAIIWHTPSSTPPAYVMVRVDTPTSYYTGGTFVNSNNSGVDWNTESGYDFVFKEYGVVT